MHLISIIILIFHIPIQLGIRKNEFGIVKKRNIFNFFLENMIRVCNV